MYGPLRVGKDNLHITGAPIPARCLARYCRCGSGPGHRPAFDDWPIRVGCPDRPTHRLCLNAPFAPEDAARIAIALRPDNTGLSPFHPRALMGLELDVRPRDLGDDDQGFGSVYAALRDAYATPTLVISPKLLLISLETT